jgi:hypothetical protein
VDVITDDTLQALMASLLSTQVGDPPAYPTAAGPNVFLSRSWRTPPGGMPEVLVQSPNETKQNVAGRTGPGEFWTTGSFRIVARVYAKSDAGDAGAAAVSGAMGMLKRQIEVCLINADALRRAIQQFVSIESVTDVKSEGGFTFGEVEMTFRMEYYQGPEDFAPVPGDPFTEIALYADLVNVFSAQSDFDPALEPFTLDNPAPRTAGPDGRPEAKVLLELPQD